MFVMHRSRHWLNCMCVQTKETLKVRQVMMLSAEINPDLLPPYMLNKVAQFFPSAPDGKIDQFVGWAGGQLEIHLREIVCMCKIDFCTFLNQKT